MGAATETPLYRWATEVLGEDLRVTLQAWRADGLTLDQMVDELRDRDVVMSRETVRRALGRAAA